MGRPSPTATLCRWCQRPRRKRRERLRRPRQGRAPGHGSTTTWPGATTSDGLNLDLLGGTVGIIQSGMNEIDKQEGRAPATSSTAPTPSSASTTCATTYGRDVQQGASAHGYAIVDEVDKILIDEAGPRAHLDPSPSRPPDSYIRSSPRWPRDWEPGRASQASRPSRRSTRRTSTFEPEEKHKTVAVTERGVEKAEKFLSIDNLYRADTGNLINHLLRRSEAGSRSHTRTSTTLVHWPARSRSSTAPLGASSRPALGPGVGCTRRWRGQGGWRSRRSRRPSPRSPTRTTWPSTVARGHDRQWLRRRPPSS